MPGILAGHGDAVIAALAVLLGVLARLPLDWWSRRAESHREQATWLRGRQLAAYGDVLAAARDVRRTFESRYQSWRRQEIPEPGSDAEAEAALTALVRSIDLARLVPGLPAAVLDAVHGATRALVVTTRSLDFTERHAQRAAFEAALDAFIRAVQAVLS